MSQIKPFWSIYYSIEWYRHLFKRAATAYTKNLHELTLSRTKEKFQTQYCNSLNCSLTRFW